MYCTLKGVRSINAKIFTVYRKTKTKKMNTYQYFRNKLRFRSEKLIVPNQSFEILKSQEIMKIGDHVEKKMNRCLHNILTKIETEK